MLFSAVYTQVFLLFGMHSMVMGTPVPNTDQSIKNVVPSANKLVVMGKLHTVDAQSRSVASEESDSLPDRRYVTPWGSGPDQNEALQLHNRVRSKLGLRALLWDTSLEEKAKEWARHLAQIKQLQLENTRTLGENIAFYYSTRETVNPITLATKGWIDTGKKYHQEIIPEGDFQGYAPYTQIVWKNTTRVGIGAAYDGNGTWYTVGYYSPAGNMYGSRPY